MAELDRAVESKQQMERDFSNKSNEFLSLSAEFLALKVSFEVCPRSVCHNSICNNCADITEIMNSPPELFTSLAQEMA